MSIIEEVQKISREQTAIFRRDANFIELEEFYKVAIESGVAKKPEYTLPQLDTIGIFFNTNKSSDE